MESILKNEKLIKVVRLFPCLWQVNTKSYKDAVANANENSHVAGVGQKLALSRSSFASFAFCSVETKQKEAVFPRILHRWSHSSSLPPFLIFINYARALRLIRIHVVQTLGTLNCERSSATSLRPTLTLRS